MDLTKRTSLYEYDDGTIWRIYRLRRTRNSIAAAETLAAFVVVDRGRDERPF